MVELTSLPEELLERIIALAILPSSLSPCSPAVPQTSLPRSTSAPFPTRPSSSQSFLPRSISLRSQCSSDRSVHRYTPLLTGSLFARIGAAVLYTHVQLSSAAQCAALERTLSSRPDLARRVKSLRVDGVWLELHGLVQSLQVPGGCLDTFDMTIAAVQRYSLGGDSAVARMFCEALTILPTLGTVKSLTVRKAADAYLTLPGPASIIECLSDLIGRWQCLETIHIGFRLPSGPRRTFSNPMVHSNSSSSSPCAKFVAALSRAPSLRVVSAQLPAAWNSSLLEISTNPSLTTIKLEPSPPVAGPHHLFLVEAGRHPRLDALIRAGSLPVPRHASPRRRSETVSSISTTSGRLRANTTLGTSSPPASTVAFPTTISPTSGPASPVETNAAAGPTSVVVQRQVSQRKSGKGHPRPPNKWSRRRSIV